MKIKNINASQTPLYRDAGFFLKDGALTKETFAKELNHEQEPDHYIYSRYRNPTTVAVEKQIMALEECEWALLVESGMAAIDVAVSLFKKGKIGGHACFFMKFMVGQIHL